MSSAESDHARVIWQIDLPMYKRSTSADSDPTLRMGDGVAALKGACGASGCRKPYAIPLCTGMHHFSHCKSVTSRPCRLAQLTQYVLAAKPRYLAATLQSGKAGTRCRTRLSAGTTRRSGPTPAAKHLSTITALDRPLVQPPCGLVGACSALARYGNAHRATLSGTGDPRKLLADSTSCSGSCSSLVSMPPWPASTCDAAAVHLPLVQHVLTTHVPRVAKLAGVRVYDGASLPVDDGCATLMYSLDCLP